MQLKISHEMMLNDLMATSHANQIRDKLYREFKKKKENLKFHNVADEVLAVNSMCPNGESNTLGIICKKKKRPPPSQKKQQPLTNQASFILTNH